LIEGWPRVLPACITFRRISQPRTQDAGKLGVTVLLRHDHQWVTASVTFPAQRPGYQPLKVWAADVRRFFSKSWTAWKSNRINQLHVRLTLQTTLDDNIFAFGDCAATGQQRRAQRTASAQAARQQAYSAKS
jgi:NADH dehydrogenase